MKYEWRKKDKEIYIPKTKPIITNVPEMNYITIKGEGSPGSDLFKDCVQALYAISYGVKMTLKGNTELKDYTDYTVFPLEGIWDLNEEGRTLYQTGKPITELKDNMVFTMMIRQPSFVPKEYIETIQESVYKKKKLEKVKDVQFEKITEGLVCQMIHIGSYNDEPQSFKLMENYCNENGYTRISKTHKEIYLSNPSSVEESKLKTTIRFKIEKKTV